MKCRITTDLQTAFGAVDTDDVRFKVGVEQRRVAHAIDVETGDVACGHPSEGLAVLPDADWESASLLEKCPACEVAVGGLAP